MRDDYRHKVAVLVAAFAVLIDRPALAKDKMLFWNGGFHGANASSQLSAPDLLAAKADGITTFRLGATGADNDFRYLVTKDGDLNLSSQTLDRLRSSIDRFGKHGFKIILTLSSVPGRVWFHRKTDVRLFQSARYQREFADGWKLIAQKLANDPYVIGYDLINEPVLPEEAKDTPVDYQTFSPGAGHSLENINVLYAATIDEIRSVDKQTPIILEPTHWAAVQALPALKKSSDSRVIYSIHYYQPFAFYHGKVDQDRLRYPGPIPLGGPIWDRARQYGIFSGVEAWRVENYIPPSHIYVGEFGAWKDAHGAEEYLHDVISILDSFHWSWTYYAFREDSFPHSDLELQGGVKARSDTPLFNLVWSDFR